MYYQDMAAIRPDYITLYSQYVGDRKATPKMLSNYANLTENRPNPQLSDKARRNIKQAINWMVAQSKPKWIIHPTTNHRFKFRVNFCTLTLPAEQKHSDQVIKKECLNHFLTTARRAWKVKHYIWRAEPQKNGNIHFHITLDKYVHWREVRNEWNRCVERLGYVSAFREKHGHRDPNSTDIHSVKDVKNIAAYLSKYCTKANETRDIEGKQWGLSTSLSKAKSAKVEMSIDIRTELQTLCRAKKLKVVRHDRCIIIYNNNNNLTMKDAPTFTRAYKTYLRLIRYDKLKDVIKPVREESSEVPIISAVAELAMKAQVQDVERQAEQLSIFESQHLTAIYGIRNPSEHAYVRSDHGRKTAINPLIEYITNHSSRQYQIYRSDAPRLYANRPPADDRCSFPYCIQ